MTCTIIPPITIIGKAVNLTSTLFTKNYKRPFLNKLVVRTMCDVSILVEGLLEGKSVHKQQQQLQPSKDCVQELEENLQARLQL